MSILPSCSSENHPTYWLDGALRLLIALGVTLVVLVPAARGFNVQLGWLPMWLVAMPAVAWWALHWFRLPQRRDVAERQAVVTRRVPWQRLATTKRRRKPMARVTRSRAA